MEDCSQTRREIVAVQNLCGTGEYTHLIQVFKFRIKRSAASDVGKLVIVMEKCDGTLSDYFQQMQREAKHFNTTAVFGIARHILGGLLHCHKKGFSHRDLKPTNGTFIYYHPVLIIVLYSMGRHCRCCGSPFTDRQCCFLLADFGYSKPYSGNDVSSLSHGTTRFRAPELITKHKYSDKTDIWAFGCLLMLIATTGKRYPFDDDWQAVEYAKGNRALKLLDKSDNPHLNNDELERINKTINLCLQPEPDERPTAQELDQEMNQELDQEPDQEFEDFMDQMLGSFREMKFNNTQQT
jgi:serine/threonine protein kinase